MIGGISRKINYLDVCRLTLQSVAVVYKFTLDISGVAPPRAKQEPEATAVDHIKKAVQAFCRNSNHF